MHPNVFQVVALVAFITLLRLGRRELYVSTNIGHYRGKEAPVRGSTEIVSPQEL